MRTVFFDRSFAAAPAVEGVTFTVDGYSTHSNGGPKEAKITATGPDLALWEMVEKMRAPVKVYSDLGDCVWWGYLSDIDGLLKNPFGGDKGYFRVGVSVDSMANRIAYAYTLLDPDTGETTRTTTDWIEDATSIATYGTVELLMSKSYATGAHATAAVNTKLAQVRYPQPTIGLEEGEASELTLTCRGWWDTLDNTYYSNVGTASVDTAAQVGTIIAQEAQYLVGVINELSGGTSGYSTPLWRDGDATSLMEVTDLLEAGTHNGRRMLASVDENRYVRLYEEPASTTYYLMDTRGQLYDQYGGMVRAETCPAGIWVKFKDLLPPSVDVSRLADPTLVFVEQMEYDAKAKRLKLTPRGYLDAWEFAMVRDG